MNSSLLLRDKDRAKLQAILERHLPEVTAWAYGSRVNGNAHDTSDLDLVLRSADLSPIPPAKMSALIEAMRESNIPILIEARDWSRLPASFHQQIERNYSVLREGSMPPSTIRPAPDNRD
jgi:predicted nucleotidyltransferase